MPHLDTRVLDGNRMILFGPFATFSTKYLKEGSYWDLFSSMTTSNFWPMTQVGLSEFSLVRYLIGQVMQSDDDRFEAMQTYYPEANKDDWRLWQAGQRVQIIKRDADKGGVLKLGTEVVTSKDGSIAGLLGASLGASTAAPIMLDLLERAFKDQLASAAWQEKLREIVPSNGVSLNENPQQFQEVWTYTSRLLQLATADAEVDDEEAGPSDLQPIDQSQETEKDLDPELTP